MKYAKRNQNEVINFSSISFFSLSSASFPLISYFTCLAISNHSWHNWIGYVSAVFYGRFPLLRVLVFFSLHFLLRFKPKLVVVVWIETASKHQQRRRLPLLTAPFTYNRYMHTLPFVFILFICIAGDDRENIGLLKVIAVASIFLELCILLMGSSDAFCSIHFAIFSSLCWIFFAFAFFLKSIDGIVLLLLFLPRINRKIDQ